MHCNCCFIFSLRAAEKERLEKREAAALKTKQARAEAERKEEERLSAEAERQERERTEEEERERVIERERISAEAQLLMRQQQLEEEGRLLLEKKQLEEQLQLAAAEANRQEELKRIERERQLEEEAQLRDADRLEKEHLAAAAAEQAAAEQRAEMERLEQKRLLLLEDHRKRKQAEEEETRQRLAREEEEAAAAVQLAEEERCQKEEKVEKARLAQLDREQMAAEAQFHAQQKDAYLAQELQNQGINASNAARKSAAELAQMRHDHSQLQMSNKEYRTTCEQLKDDLYRAAESISKLKVAAAEQEEKEMLRREQEVQRVADEESSLLASAKLDMETQLTHLRDSTQSQINSLERELVEERKLSVDHQREMQLRLEEATVRLSSVESDRKAQESKKEAKTAKQLGASEKAAAKAVALLDRKDEEVVQLQKVIADMRGTMEKKKLEEDEAEEEMDELHNENEELHLQIEKMQKENSEMTSKLANVSDDSEKMGDLKMELQLLEEERIREKSALTTAHEKTSQDHALVIHERDEKKAQARDLEQILTAAQADLELANTDRNRALVANENLQRALEDFQSERDSETALLSEQRMLEEEAFAAAHAASLEATREANAVEMRDVQYAAERSCTNSLVEIDKMEATVQECRRDNLNLRKALDEAISRLQTNQEDVIDRSLIKNVILDWHSKKGKAKRDVMILLGSILHFTEDEKDKAFIGEGLGTLDKVYGAVAAPLPPAKLNVDKIEGENVREKWVNFLLAETGEEEADS